MAEALTVLPTDVLISILSRLPLKTLFACRCTCKTLLHLISSDSNFNAAHSSNASAILMLQFRGLYCTDGFNFSPPHLHFFDPEIEFPPARIPPYSYYRFKPNLSLVNSCNGLLYLSTQTEVDALSIVLNPVTNEYVTIPEVDHGERPGHNYSLGTWLGFCLGTSQYKVLNIYKSVGFVVQAKIIVVGRNSWVDVKGLIPRHHHFRPPLDATYTLLSGVLYWLYGGKIYFFDFEAELFGKITYLPSELDLLLQCNGWLRLNLGVFEGSLCLTFNAYGQVRFWVMKGNKNRNVIWIERLLVDYSGYWFSTKGSVKPLHVLKNGKVLMFCDRLVCYDPSTKSFVVGTGPEETNRPPRIVSLVPSFTSLKDILNVDEATVQRCILGC